MKPPLRRFDGQIVLLGFTASAALSGLVGSGLGGRKLLA
jgi:hypothetical protein